MSGNTYDAAAATAGVLRSEASESLVKRTFAQSAWNRFVAAAKPYFFAASTERSDDHLVEVVRREPVAATRFIQSIAFFSSVGNLLVVVACSAFLSLYWSRCADCDRPLRWWLFVQALLQLSQLPVRVVLFFSVRNVQTTGGSIMMCITSLTASQAWRASKTVAIFQYGWFVLGMVWWMHTESCPSCPGIGKLTASIMVLSAARAAITLSVFRLAFSDADVEPEAPKVVAASHQQISAIPLVHFSASANNSEESQSCSICLADYIDGDLMRRLPCQHDFHRRCIDKWLHRNKRCPLCVHAVDEPCDRPQTPQ